MPIRAHLHTQDIAKPALVLVHGLGSAGTIWKSLIPQLIEHFSVYAIDLPGHGVAELHPEEKYDPKSLAEAIVDEMGRTHGVTEMHVAGNSLGPHRSPRAQRACHQAGVHRKRRVALKPSQRHGLRPGGLAVIKRVIKL